MTGDFNGQITVTPDVGAVGDYTWEWFEGQNTDPSNEIPANAVTTATVTDNVLSEIPGGTYTLRMTDNTTQCVNTTPVMVFSWIPPFG